VFVELSGGSRELLDKEFSVLGDDVLDFEHSASDHTENGLCSLGLHLHELFSLAPDVPDLFARHLATVGLELGHALAHEADYLFNSVELGIGSCSTFLVLAGSSFGFHVSHPSSTVSFNCRSESLSGLLD